MVLEKMSAKRETWVHLDLLLLSVLLLDDMCCVVFIQLGTLHEHMTIFILQCIIFVGMIVED